MKIRIQTLFLGVRRKKKKFREREMGGEKERLIIGKSILVPSVQELAKATSLRVPDRYIRSDQDSPNLAVSIDEYHHHGLQIPIIDLGKIICGDELELQRFHSACRDWGFFQLINHEVDSELVEKFKVETQEFFNLPMEEKKKYWQTPTDIEGFGHVFVVSEEQKLDWSDTFYLSTLPKHYRRANLIPMLPLPYRDTFESYSTELHNLQMKILECIAKALKIDTEVLKGMFGEGKQSIRMNYYPPCPQADKVMGLTAHSDANALAIVLQLNEVDGLQIRKDDKWVSVKPLPDAFIVNLGDIMEILTNGIYRSVVHRAIVNPVKDRMSVATFYSAGNHCEIGPISNFVTPETPALYRKINMVDYRKGLFASGVVGKSYLDAMRINQSRQETKV